VAHTGVDGELPVEKIPAGNALQIPGRTVVVLQVD
jgi:glycogen debranching enzyme